MNRKFVITALLSILLIAGFLRIFRLDSVPPGIFRDEAEKGYTSWSLTRTGSYPCFTGDKNNALKFADFPLFVNVFGVYTSATYQYSAIPFMFFGGLNEWTTRLPAALAGLLTVLLCFYLVRTMTGDDLAALLSAFLLAVSPWHVLFSRWALQGIFIPLFVTAGLWLFFLGIRKKPYFLLLSSLAFSLAFYTYAAARVFVPLLLVLLLIIYFRKLWTNRKWTIGSVVLFLAICVPVFFYYISGGRSIRYDRLSIFGEGRGIFQSMVFFIRNYLSHYHPSFLFLHGDSQLRHSLLGMGMMYLFELPLLVIGLILALRRKKRFHYLMLAWFLIFPVAASLTTEGIPHALRSITALPLLPVLCGMAGAYLIRKSREYMQKDQPSREKLLKIAAVLIILVIGLNVVRMGRNLFFRYPEDSFFQWQYGMKQALSFVHEKEIDQSDVYISGFITYAPYLVMFYDRIPPNQLREDGMKALKYNFLPPSLTGIPVDAVLRNSDNGGWLILMHGELRSKPDYTIYPPGVDPRNQAEAYPALEVHHIDNGSSQRFHLPVFPVTR